MDFKLDALHNVDVAKSEPTDGYTLAPGLNIAWKQCPVEAVIVAAADRLQFYQRLKFKCPETREALLHLHMALDALARRTKDREARGVEGTSKA